MAVERLHLEWHGEEVKERLNEAAAAGLNAAATALRGHMSFNLSIQGPPRSLPGQFPHMDTGTLRRSLKTEKATASSLYAAAGVDATAYNEGTLVDDYALYLEFGTMRMAPRPWILRTLDENRTEIVSTFMQAARAAMNAGSA